MNQLSPAQLFDCPIPSFKLQNFSQIYSIRDDRITGCPPLPPIVLALREDGRAMDELSACSGRKFRELIGPLAVHHRSNCIDCQQTA